MASEKAVELARQFLDCFAAEYQDDGDGGSEPVASFDCTRLERFFDSLLLAAEERALENG